MKRNEMLYKNYLSYIFMITLWFVMGISLSAYGVDEYITRDFIDSAENITKGKLAIMLVNSIGLQSELPNAPIGPDYIKILEKNGIRPLDGWVPSKLLTKGDFAVILACAMGLDTRLVSSQEICEENKEYVQKMWDAQYRQDGYYKNLKELFQDKRFFPKGPPATPYGDNVYIDKEGNHRVGIAIGPENKETNPIVKYIVTLEKKGIDLKGAPQDVLTLKA